MHRIIKIAVGTTGLAAAALTATSTAAHAAVIVNPDGSGFVGKGDVQSALHYNNKQMQEATEAKGFSWNEQQQIKYNYTWNTDGQARHMTWTMTSTRPMAAAEARTNSNGKDGSLTGWNLTGAGAWTYGIPVYTGEDYNHDGVKDANDIFDAGYSDMQFNGGYTYTNVVNGSALPGVTLPAGDVPTDGAPVV